VRVIGWLIWISKCFTDLQVLRLTDWFCGILTGLPVSKPVETYQGL